MLSPSISHSVILSPSGDIRVSAESGPSGYCLRMLDHDWIYPDGQGDTTPHSSCSSNAQPLCLSLSLISFKSMHLSIESYQACFYCIHSLSAHAVVGARSNSGARASSSSSSDTGEVDSSDSCGTEPTQVEGRRDMPE